MKTTTPKIKAQAYGLKFDGKMYKCSVSRGTHTKGEKGFFIYADKYGRGALPSNIPGWANDTDSQTDCFEKDRIYVGPSHPFYRAWVGELRRKRNIDRARYRVQENKRAAKWAARHGKPFVTKNPFTKWFENHEHYKTLIAAKAQREAAEASRIAAQVYKANQPPALTVLPRPARCAPAAWSVARVLPVCRPAAWSFDRVAGL